MRDLGSLFCRKFSLEESVINLGNPKPFSEAEEADGGNADTVSNKVCCYFLKACPGERLALLYQHWLPALYIVSLLNFYNKAARHNSELNSACWIHRWASERLHWFLCLMAPIGICVGVPGSPSILPAQLWGHFWNTCFNCEDTKEGGQRVFTEEMPFEMEDRSWGLGREGWIRSQQAFWRSWVRGEGYTSLLVFSSDPGSQSSWVWWLISLQTDNENLFLLPYANTPGPQSLWAENSPSLLGVSIYLTLPGISTSPWPGHTPQEQGSSGDIFRVSDGSTWTVLHCPLSIVQGTFSWWSPVKKTGP